ncbi:biotin--[acetyl-CoA-carboxylase] ligase [Ruminococcus sp. Marseille-P6503]|uniref:biotin--[acetyl-CoA-carboxylase] ligase n=1 Tax=Ruminococcus sp. Marseille-P6503 TaxID=2364796 RepID=UPI000F52AFCB|nr:biotin--[acetyl-CoA-carboxylase] ligase [Ruminococcus sp. Marseille-P6503]
MKLKEKILKILEDNRGRPVSGSQTAKQLKVSRNAVWKAVEELRSSGIGIEAARNSGYFIPENENSLTVQGVEAILGKSDYSIHVEDSVTSTNTILKKLAQQGCREGYVLIARQQTAGKGRLGRSFYSPPDSGLYLSVVLRPQMNIQDALFITTSAAVAVSRAIETCCNHERKARIKWVNDIYLDGRKVCGILTEAALDFESGGLEYAVLGIGVNITPPDGDFPPELSDVAASVFSSGKTGNLRNRLAAEILRELSALPDGFLSDEILDEYRRRSMLTGKDVFALFKDETKPCHVLGIDDRARLLVRFKDGTEQALSSGEVSIKPLPPQKP